MKIAASDFDHTLFFPEKDFNGHKGIAQSDIAAIDKWRAAGNVFGIVTGRSYKMLLQNIKAVPLHYDFIICLTGAAVYDAQGFVISQRTMDNIVSRQLISSPLLQKSRHIACLTAYSEFVQVLSELSWFKTMKNSGEFTLVDNFMAQCIKGICQISLQYENAAEAKQAVKEINSLYCGVTAYQNEQAVDIVRREVSKASAIGRLLILNSWKASEILTIGDGTNDLPMIEEFSGFAMDCASDLVKQRAAKIYKNVAEMLSDHLT